jgi:hypothetical protein
VRGRPTAIGIRTEGHPTRRMRPRNKGRPAGN